MHRFILPTILVSAIAAGGGALAAQSTTSRVVSIDKDALTMLLSDQQVYRLPSPASAAGIRPGDTLWVSYDDAGGFRDVHFTTTVETRGDS